MELESAQFLALSREILGRGCSLRFQATGSSMFPAIPSGSVIRVEPAEPASLRPGDVIFYRHGIAGLAVHRLVGRRAVQGKVRLLTRGDSLPRGAVEEVAPEQVLGRVAAVAWRGLALRLDAGPGRALGLLLARMAPLALLLYPAWRRLKEIFSRQPRVPRSLSGADIPPS